MRGWEGWPCNCFIGFGALRSLLNKSKGVFACRPSIETWARWAFFLEISRVQVGGGAICVPSTTGFCNQKMGKHGETWGTGRYRFTWIQSSAFECPHQLYCKWIYLQEVFWLNLWCYREIDLPMHYYQATCNSELQPKEEFLRKHRYQDGLSMDLPLLRRFAVRLMDVSAPSAPIFDGSCRSWQCHASNGISCRRRFPASIPSTSWPKSVVGDDPGKVPIPRGYSWFQGKVEETCCQSKGDIANSFPFLICHHYIQHISSAYDYRKLAWIWQSQLLFP